MSLALKARDLDVSFARRWPAVDRRAARGSANPLASDRADHVRCVVVRLRFHWRVADARWPDRDSPLPARHSCDECDDSENNPSPAGSGQRSEESRAPSKSMEKALAP